MIASRLAWINHSIDCFVLYLGGASVTVKKHMLVVANLFSVRPRNLQLSDTSLLAVRLFVDYCLPPAIRSLLTLQHCTLQVKLRFYSPKNYFKSYFAYEQCLKWYQQPFKWCWLPLSSHKTLHPQTGCCSFATKWDCTWHLSHYNATTYPTSSVDTCFICYRLLYIASNSQQWPYQQQMATTRSSHHVIDMWHVYRYRVIDIHVMATTTITWMT